MKVTTLVTCASWFVGISLGLLACTTMPEEASPETLFTVPANFPQPVYALDQNQLTPAGVKLGRALF